MSSFDSRALRLVGYTLIETASLSIVNLDAKGVALACSGNAAKFSGDHRCPSGSA